MSFRMHKNWRWLVALGAVFVPGVVSGAIALPFSFSSGATIKAAEVNANFDALRTRLDGLTSSTSNRPSIGTLTLAGLLSNASIRKFSQSFSVPASTGTGAGSGKVTASDIEIVRDVDSASPALNLAFVRSQNIASAQLVIGGFKAQLSNVLVTSIKIAPPQADRPQEVLTLSYANIDWTFTPATGPSKTASYNKAQSTGSGGNTANVKYGIAPAGVALDGTFTPALGYSHAMTLPASTGTGGGTGKAQHGAVSVVKGVGVDVTDDLGRIVTGKTNSTVEVQALTSATVANNSVKLTGALTTGVALTTRDDGSFVETIDWSYTTITWTAGTATATWDVAANK